MNPYHRVLLGSVLGILVTAMAVISPIVISDALEPIETAREDIRRTEEIITETNTTINYTPYWEHNETTGSFDDSADTDVYVLTDGPFDYTLDATYNYDGYNDLFVNDQEITRIYIRLNVNWVDAIENGATLLFINLSFANPDYAITTCYADIIDENGTRIDQIGLASWSGLSNNTEVTYDIQEYKAPDILTMCEGVPAERQRLSIAVWTYSGPYPSQFSSNIQINPEYMQENVTTYENTTVTTWEPFFLSYSYPYYWIRGLLGLGGGVLFLVSLVSTPWIDPSEWIVRPGSRRSGGRKNLRRRGSNSRSRRRKR